MFEVVRDVVTGQTTDPIKEEIHGVTVYYENSSLRKDTWDDWYALLDEWIPLLDEAGWVEGINRVEIGNGYMSGRGEGEYQHKTQTISFEQNPRFSKRDPDFLVGQDWKHALVHEFAHHAHISSEFSKPLERVTVMDLNLMQAMHNFGQHQPAFRKNVSIYSGRNYLEAVAETATGITFGEEYPRRVLRAYKEFGGPTPPRNAEQLERL